MIDTIKSYLPESDATLNINTEIITKRPLLTLSVFIIVFYAIVGFISFFVVPDPTERVASGATGPSLSHPFGTTWMGESVLYQFLHSIRWALTIAILSALVAIFIGVNIGLLSGYFGGKVEEGLMMLTDIAMGLPVLPFGLVIAGIVSRSPIIITIAVGAILWRTIARVVRSETKSLKEREFVLAAKARGASDIKIIYKHILPNLYGLISVYLPLAAAWGLLTVAGIAFLGMFRTDMITWGMMIRNAWTSGMMLNANWWFAFPAFGLGSLIVSLLIISREVERITNPELE